MGLPFCGRPGWRALPPPCWIPEVRIKSAPPLPLLITSSPWKISAPPWPKCPCLPAPTMWWPPSVTPPIVKPWAGCSITGDAAYTGMIGSSRKIAAIREKLLAQGITPAQLAAVHAPIGLSLGGETPEEIAVSILAELLMTRYGKTKADL